MDIWRDVVGYEGIYEVSSGGKVRTVLGKKTHSTWHGERVWAQRELKQKVSKDGNHRVCLYKDKKEKTWLVHRLVALAFLPLIEGKRYVNHIDGSRYNNDVENLEWCDHTENNNHAFDTGLINTGDKIVLTNEENGEALEFRSMSKASKFLGKSNGYVSSLLSRGINNCGKYKIEKVNPE